MKKYVWMCIVSGAIGATLAMGVMERVHEGPAGAQDGPPVVRPAGRPPGTPLPQIARQPLAASPLPVAAPRLSEEFTAEELINIRVYEATNRGVVNITTKSAPIETFFGASEPAEGAGSGSILDTAGHILTNYHVIAGANQITVTLFDGNSYQAGLVGQDPLNDIAVLRISAPAEALHPISIGDSSRLRVGQKIYAIGNPFGLERTMTVGIISSLNRSLPSNTGRTMKSIIQIDAALNRGNSGGPLLSSQGQLIGMNTAIASRVGENSGVGFAIPIATISRVIPQLIENGKVVRPSIGIAQVYQTDKGLVVAVLAPDGPAERAGLKGFRIVREQKRRGPFVFEERSIDRNSADLIIGAEGRPVTSADDLMTLIESKKPGQTINLTVVRDEREIEVPVKLGASD